jgi:hypothetical protein
MGASGGAEKAATGKAIRGPQRPILAFFLLSFLSACATYHPQPLSPERSAAAFQARSLDDPKLRDFLSDYGRTPKHWPKQDWNLNDLVLVALYESPELAVQRARWQVARANVITAGQRPNPSIGFLSQHHSIAPEGVLPWTLGFSFDIPSKRPANAAIASKVPWLWPTPRGSRWGKAHGRCGHWSAKGSWICLRP